MIVGGGGIQGGRVIGASDALAEKPATDPVTPEDLAVTMFHRLGIDPQDEFYGPMAARTRSPTADGLFRDCGSSGAGLIQTNPPDSPERLRSVRTRIATMTSFVRLAVIFSVLLGVGPGLTRADAPLANYVFPAGDSAAPSSQSTSAAAT